MDSTNEKKTAEAPGGAQPPPAKKPRSTVDLRNPTIYNFEQIWMDGPFPEDSLKTAEGLFGHDRVWFVRDAYISLFDAIMSDEHYMQIVNGSAGIGKSAFLLYMLARMHNMGKSVLLHVHRDIAKQPQAIFFPADGSEPTRIERSDNASAKIFDEWYRAISANNSVILIDGIVSFTLEDYPNVKYVAAKSPCCSIGWMDKAQMRRDRWLKVWQELELVSYAQQVNVPNAKEVVHNNFLHLGGVSRYAFVPNAAESAALTAVSRVGAKELFKLVDKGLLAKFDDQKVVDRLIHRHPPPGEVGVNGVTFTFASEFVSTKVAMALALENEIETATLLAKFKGVGPAGGMRGVLFEAYAARKLAEGDNFPVREIETGKATILELDRTIILQKDTKTLNMTEDGQGGWFLSFALFGDSKLALALSTTLLVIAIVVSLYVDGDLPFLETLSPSEIAYRELGPVPIIDPATIFQIDESQSAKSQISNEMLEAYNRDGVIAVRGILDSDDLDALDRATRTMVEEQRNKNAIKAQQKPKLLTGRKPSANQFYTVRQSAIFQPAENENDTSAFVKVGMMSDIPAIAANLLQFDPDTCTNQTVRILRDIFLAKDEEEYVCGWHVDDIGFWPALSDAPGVNAWIALDDMPVHLGGGFALAVGSHKSDWRHDAYDLTGSTHSFPPGGFSSSHDILQKRPGNGTCNIKATAPHLDRRMEEMKRVYDIKRGDVIFHDRWLFHRTVPFERGVVSERISKDETPLMYRRYSIRFGPGNSVIPPGYNVILSVISDHTNGGRTADDVSKNDAAWYPKVWPVVDEAELESMKKLAKKRLPEATEKSEQRKRMIRPRRKNQH